MYFGRLLKLVEFLCLRTKDFLNCFSKSCGKRNSYFLKKWLMISLLDTHLLRIILIKIVRKLYNELVNHIISLDKFDKTFEVAWGAHATWRVEKSTQREGLMLIENFWKMSSTSFHMSIRKIYHTSKILANSWHM